MSLKRFTFNKKKIILFIILPVLATFIMSVGIYISRMTIRGWIRIYGSDTALISSKSAYRILVRKKKFNKTVSPVKVKVYLKFKDSDILIGKSENSKGDSALSLNVTYPNVPQGTYKLKWEIDSEIGEEIIYTNIKLLSQIPKLKRFYEDNDGEDTNGNYASILTSISKPDKYNNIIALHPVNSRGLKTYFKDIVFLRAHTKQGKPLRIKATIKLLRGNLRFPKTPDCNPPIIKRDKEECMIEIKEGQKIPFELKTDQLGLVSMTLYPISHGASFEITYTMKNNKGEWGKYNIIQYDLGSVEDDVLVGYFPKILSPNKQYSLPLKVMGKGPLYIDIFNKWQWVHSGIARIDKRLGLYILDTNGLSGMYKLQTSLTYIPVSNLITNTTFWVSDNLKDPSILNECINNALKNNRNDQYLINYLSYLKKYGEVWKPGYKFDEDSFFFTGLLDPYHFAPLIISDTKQQKEASLSATKKKGQTIVLTIIAISGILLVLTIIFALFLLINEREKSQINMSKIMEDSSGETEFWQNEEAYINEKDARYRLVGFGILIALIVSFSILAIIWLMFNIKWTM